MGTVSQIMKLKDIIIILLISLLIAPLSLLLTTVAILEYL